MAKEPSEVMIFGEREFIISVYKAGRLPDPRITLPLYQKMNIFDDDIFICAFDKCVALSGRHSNTYIQREITKMLTKSFKPGKFENRRYLSGTHWVWEMCQMLIKGKAEFYSQSKNSCMMEHHMPEDFNDLQRPRIFNTHFTPLWIPRQAIEKKSKFIILRRNPKDIVTSRYYHHIIIKELITNGTTDTSWHSFLQNVFNNDREVSSNWFFYNKKWTDFIESHGQLVLVLSYEDIKLNNFDCLSKIAEFIGFPRDDSVLDTIIKKCSISNMRDIEKDRPSGSSLADSQQISKLYRKGVVGDWKEHFTVAENEQFDAFLKKYMKDEDLNFKYEL